MKNESKNKKEIINISNSFCDLYKKKCIGGLCSVTPFPEKCKYRKQNEKKKNNNNTTGRRFIVK